MLPEDERRRAAALFETLRRPARARGRAPLGDLVGAALEETRLVELAARAYHGQQTVSNLLKLKRLAVEASDGRGATLKEFAARVREAARESRREGESPLADEKPRGRARDDDAQVEGPGVPRRVRRRISPASPAAAARSPSSRLDAATGRAALRLGAIGLGRDGPGRRAREGDGAPRVRAPALRRDDARPRGACSSSAARRPASGALASHLHAAGSWPGDGRDGRLPLKGLEIGTLNVERNEDSGEEELAYVPGKPDEDPLFRCLKGELEDRLTEAISKLPDRERLVMTLYYYEELTMREIGLALGVVESRVSQVHAAALVHMRAKLRDLATCSLLKCDPLAVRAESLRRSPKACSPQAAKDRSLRLPLQCDRETASGNGESGRRGIPA